MIYKQNMYTYELYTLICNGKNLKTTCTNVKNADLLTNLLYSASVSRTHSAGSYTTHTAELRVLCDLKHSIMCNVACQADAADSIIFLHWHIMGA